MYRLLPTITLALLPLFAAAQTNGLANFMINLNVFLGWVVIPFLLGMAFLIFIWNAIKYFVIKGQSEEGREKARALALYSILAFVLIITFWGIVNMFNDGLGLGGVKQPDFDYVNAAP
jgi:hypothetical protein